MKNFNHILVFISKLAIIIFLGYLTAFIFLINPFYPLVFFAAIIPVFVFFVSKEKVIYFFIVLLPFLTMLSNSSSFNLGNTTSINFVGYLNLLLPMLAIVSLRKKEVESAFFFKPIVFFFAVIAFSIVFSPEKMISLRQVFRYAMMFALYFLVLSQSFSYCNVLRVLQIILISLLPSVFVALMQFTGGYSIFNVIGLNRVFGLYGHPSHFAMILVVICAILLFFILNKKNKFQWFYLIYFFIASFLLFNTFTRIGWFSFTIVLLIMGILKLKRLLVVVLFVFATIFILLPETSHVVVERLKPDSSFWGRFKLNDFGFELFKQKPIFGHGIGSYAVLSAKEFGSSSTAYGVKVGVTPHNDYIRFLSETGFVGLFAFLLIFVTSLRFSIKLINEKSDDIKRFGVLLLALISGIMVFSVSDQGFEYAGVYLWILLALGESIRSKEKVT